MSVVIVVVMFAVFVVYVVSNIAIVIAAAGGDAIKYPVIRSFVYVLFVINCYITDIFNILVVT